MLCTLLLYGRSSQWLVGCSGGWVKPTSQSLSLFHYLCSVISWPSFCLSFVPCSPKYLTRTLSSISPHATSITVPRDSVLLLYIHMWSRSSYAISCRTRTSRLSPSYTRPASISLRAFYDRVQWQRTMSETLRLYLYIHIHLQMYCT